MNSEHIFTKIIVLLILAVGWFLLLVYVESHHYNVFYDSYNSNQNIVQNDQDLTEQEEIFLIERPQCGAFPCYSGQDFVDIYNEFEASLGLPYLSKYILNNSEADDYIQSYAESLGYQPRVFADESTLVALETYRIQPEVHDAYIHMRNEMLEKGIRLHFVSGYRSSTDQRVIFLDKLGKVDPALVSEGVYDDALEKAFKVSAIPGYSKHHSGYTVDFGCGNDYLVYEFDTTECYVWMSENNFENIKRFGFIPSYPHEVENQGPNPEPWEFVWVGTERLK